MLERYLDELLFELRGADEFIMALPIEDRASWESLSAVQRERLKAKADDWMNRPIPPLTASAYISFSRAGIAAEYETNYRLRREMLRDLVIGSCLIPDGRYDLKLADIIWAICEESSWVLPSHNPLALGQEGRPLPGVENHKIDSAAADTASDLALAVQMTASRLDGITVQLVDRIERECMKRILQPFGSLSDTAWLCGPRGDLPRCLSGCLMAALTFERGNRPRWERVRKAWMLLDRYVSALPPDGSVPGGLEDWASVVEPVMDMVMMVLSASGGRVDVRGERQIGLMCHYPVFCRVGQNMFVNQGARSMRPALDGQLLYRVGAYQGDEALCALGVYLQRTCERPDRPQTLFHYAADLFNQSAMEREPITMPFRVQGYFSARQLMVARRAEDSERGLALAAHGGGNGALGAHADAGDFVLFCEGEPVLADAGFVEETARHNLPTVNGVGQGLGSAYAAQDVSCQLKDDYAMLTMDLTRAYPAQAGIQTWQRTFCYVRDKNVLQLMEFIELKAPSQVTFNFVTPFEPGTGDRHIQLGPVSLRWEDDMDVSCEEMSVPEGEARALWGAKLYHIALTPRGLMQNGELTFTFKALKTFGS